MIKRNGFTLIETLIALIIGSGLAISFAKYQIEETETNKIKLFSNEIEQMVSGVDKRISIDGYDATLWGKKRWENHQIKDLIKKDLQGTQSKCGTGEWIPRDNNLKLSLTDCNLFDHRLYDVTITSQIKEENGYITKFITDYGFKTKDDFNKNIEKIKRVWFLAKADTKRAITGEKIYQYVDDLNSPISFSQCLNKKEKCKFRLTLDRQGGAEYLNVDGTNSMIGSKITFIEAKGNSPLKCMRWDLNRATNKWNLKNDETCGIGIYDNTTPVLVNTALKNGTFENVLLSKKCNMYDWIGTSLMMKDSNTPCGMTKDGSTIIQLIENIHSDKALIKEIYSNNLFTKDIDSSTLLSKLITSDNIEVKNITVNNNALIKKLETVENAVFRNGITVNNGNLKVLNGDITSNKKVESASSRFSDSWIRRLSISENLLLEKTNSENAYCSHNGSLSRDRSGRILNCVNNKWVLVGEDAVPIGTVVIWSSTSIPKGWIEMNGQSTSSYPKLRAIVGSHVEDLRGVFVRGWDHGRGQDRNRRFKTFQGDAIRNITGTITGPGAVEEGGVYRGAFYYTGSGRGADGGGNTDWGIGFDASRVVPTAEDNRPKNVSLMYIIKAY